MPRMRVRPGMLAGAGAAACALSIGAFWPGIVTYDGTTQFAQALSGDYDDWHPPILAHLWAVLHGAFGGGAGPMLAVQQGLYWLGFTLIAAALAARGKPRAGVAVLAVAALPPLLGWQAVVLKDTQMLGALLAGVGLVGWWRLRGLRVPVAAWGLAGLLLAYATLVRSNAAFATVPLAVMLAGPRRWWLRLPLALGGIVAVLVLAPLINHGPLAAGRSGVERTEAIYDLAGIAVRAPATPVGLSPDAIRALAAKRCVKPFFWDPLGDPSRCDAEVEPLRDVAPGALYRRLAAAIVRAPLAYAAHRLAHLNSTERWLVGAGAPAARPPTVSQGNTLGLGSPGAVAGAWLALAGWSAETPLGWPVAWVVLALTAAAVAARRAPSPPRDLALALLVSALTLEASFAVLSIASDLRYHLWPIAAAALGGILLAAEARWARRIGIAGGVALALVLASGTAARLLLPPAPPTYPLQLL